MMKSAQPRFRSVREGVPRCWRALAFLIALRPIVACSEAPSRHAPSLEVERRRVEGPSVLLVTLDTTRADRLGCYGYDQAETPTLDALAVRGTRFARAYSSAPLTIPSHSTMFTGRFPPSHGVRNNGDFLLGAEAITLAERFAAAGWRTMASTAAFPTHRRWGLSQGFEIYRDPMVHAAAAQDWRDQRPANEVVDDAIRDLDSLDGPVFAWVHMFDAHWPYVPPEPFRSRHAGRPYDGEIAFADQQLGRLLDHFTAARPDLVVLVTADHGESLGDGGEQTHGFLLHDGTLHVPMLLAGPGVPEGRVVHAPVGHTDLVPTLLELTGLPLHEGLQGRSLLRGGSGVVYSEALTGHFRYGLAPLTARTDGAGRTTEGVYTTFHPATEDVVAVEGTPADDAQARALIALRDGLEQVQAPGSTLDADDLEMLAGLGYLDVGSVDPSGGDVDPRDVIELMPLTWSTRSAIAQGRLGVAAEQLERLQAAMPGTFGVRQLRADMLRARGDLAGALEASVELYLEAPSSTLAVQIADLYMETGDRLSARAYYEHALEQMPRSPQAMSGLVRVALAGHETETARELADRFLVLHPDHAELNLVLAEILLLDQRPAAALVEAKLGLQHMPWSLPALTLTARAHWQLGQPEQAIDLLVAARDAHPFDRSTRLLLTSWMLEVGRAAEGVRTIRPMLALYPEDRVVAEAHAAAMATLDAQRPRGSVRAAHGD